MTLVFLATIVVFVVIMYLLFRFGRLERKDFRALLVFAAFALVFLIAHGAGRPLGIPGIPGIE